MKLKPILFFGIGNEIGNKTLNYEPCRVVKGEENLILSYSSKINNEDQLFEKAYPLKTIGPNRLIADYKKFTESNLF